MGWIDFEQIWFFCPTFADELEGCEALERLEQRWLGESEQFG